MRERPSHNGPDGPWIRLLASTWVWRMAWRDSRRERRRLAVFAASIVAGICALVTIHSLRASLEQGIERQGRELLGSDLQIASRSPFERDKLRAALGGRVEAIDFETSFSTMLRFPGKGGARLVEVRSMEGKFPFYGEVRTDPAEAWRKWSEASGPFLLAGPALLEQFGAGVGDEVRLGEARLRIGGRLLEGVPRSGRFSAFAPPVFVSAETIEASGLLEETRLARYRAHLRLAPERTAEDVRAFVKEMFPATDWRFETPESRREQLGEVVGRFELFLGLMAIVSLVLGAVGVAGALYAQIRRRRSGIAMLRCLGATGRAAFAVYFVQSVVLGGLGTAAGALLGVGLHAGLVGLFREALPVSLGVFPDVWVVVRASAAGFLLCLGFAWLPLQRVAEVPPLAALRNSAADGPSGWRRWRRVLPVVAGLFLLLFVLSRMGSGNWVQGILFPVGLTVVFLLLWGTALALLAAARRFARLLPGYLPRQAVANLFRPNNQTVLFVVALGLGLFLLTTTVLLRELLMGQLQRTESDSGPNLYLVDVQPDQVDAVEEMLRREGLPILQSVPMVGMRLAGINGRDREVLRTSEAVPDWVLRKEFRSTYRRGLNASETTAGGRWPPERTSGEEPVPLSLETGMAEDLDVGLGDRVRMDVQGLELETEVTHLREVEWNTFSLNFFMVFPPEALEDAPGFHVVTTRISGATTSGPIQARIAEKFSNVSVIDLSAILRTVRSMLERIAQAVQVLSGFTLFAGLCILTGIFLNGRQARMVETVLLRTLGATKSQLRRLLCLEFGILGLIAGLAGVGLGCLGYLPLAHFAFSMDPVYPFGALAGILFGSVALALVVGGLTSRGVCKAPPLAILRRE